MKVREIQNLFNLEMVSGEKGLDREITGGYCGDLLSDVMANSTKGDVWLTVQVHQNIVAVAILKELAAIILVNGRMPDEETQSKSEEENLPILVSQLSVYQLAGQLHEVGIGKTE
jgi:predicted transcriptional regulator